MPFNIRMGIPEMELFWKDLTEKADNGKLNKSDQKLFKKLVKSFHFLSQNPRHPGLSSHEISDLSRRYGMKVWESYLENNTPSAGRIFWVYGSDQKDFTIIGINPHPEDKKRSGYDKVKLSNLE